MALPGRGDKDWVGCVKRNTGTEKQHKLRAPELQPTHWKDGIWNFTPTFWRRWRKNLCLGFKSRRRQKMVSPNNSPPQPCPCVDLSFKCVPPVWARKPYTKKLTQDGQCPGHLAKTREKSSAQSELRPSWIPADLGCSNSSNILKDI